MFEVLGDVRHTCLACGGSCQGVAVPLLGDEDRANVAEAAATLGVTEPIVDGHLRQDGGRCVFLAEDNRCRIHNTLGLERKPRVCRQFPLVALRVEDTVRVGIDPGCYTHHHSWRTGPEIEDPSMGVARIELSAAESAVEEQLVGLLGAEGLTVAQALSVLSGIVVTDAGLPAGLPGRLVSHLQRADLQRHADNPDTAPALRASVGMIARAAATWDPEAPPAWPQLDPEMDAWAVDAVRRLIWLRLVPQGPGVLPVAAFALCGVVWSTWAAEGDPARTGRLFAGWTRALRTPSVWPALLPDSEALRRLLRGS